MRPSTILLLLLLFSTSVFARDEVVFSVDNPKSLITLNTLEIAKIEHVQWRNNAYRDLAISVGYSGDVDKAVAIINKIDNPDTQAMTIRAIGMALAIHKDLSDTEYKSLFKKLNDAAITITNEGARDIAYTYIAMAQAFAGLDDDATKTTDAMINPALKHKAFGETAEIQAERGDFNAAINSINLIDSIAFKNKALNIISAIFLKDGDFEGAFKTAQMITNPTKKVDAIQKIINAKIGLDKID